MNSIYKRNFSLLALLLLISPVHAAVLVTYRGDAPNTFNIEFPYLFTTDARFDINSDGIADYRFISDPDFIAAIESINNNRFISTLSSGFDFGGHVSPVDLHSIIGANAALLYGDWHISTDNRGSMFDLNVGVQSLQYLDTYIGVEFAAADGIHYGWIQYTGFSHPEKGIVGGIPGGFINSWAYESQPGVGILAGQVPEASSLILVGVATAFCMARRRRISRPSEVEDS